MSCHLATRLSSQLLVLLALVSMMTALEGGAIVATVTPSCPDRCYCSVAVDAGGVAEGVVVRCSNAQLTSLPRPLPNDTRRLYLDYNQLVAVPTDAFRNLWQLVELDLSHNRLALLEPGALRGLAQSLRSLDLSSNQLRGLSAEALAGVRCHANLSANPWRCDCALQEALPRLELQVASLGGVVCHEEEEGGEEPGAGPVVMGVSMGGRPLVEVAQEADLCAGLKRSTDVAMLVVMFGWFTMVLSYLLYYVRANQEDARRHLQYLKSLPKGGATEDASTTSTMV